MNHNIIKAVNSASPIKVQIPTLTLYIFLSILLFVLFLLENYSVHDPKSSKELTIGISKQRKHRFTRAAKNEDQKAQLDTPTNFVDEYVEIANKFRALHGAPPLEIDYKLAVEAEKWAKYLAEKSDKQGKPILLPSWTYLTGESIFAELSTATATGIDVAKHWYNDCSSHSWDPNIFSKESSRFSQMIWKDSEWVGIGKAQAIKQGITIVVARYLPAGNWNYSSSFKENVFPLKGSSGKCYKPSSSENITTINVILPTRPSSPSSGTTADPNIPLAVIPPPDPIPDPSSAAAALGPTAPPCNLVTPKGRSLTQAVTKKEEKKGKTGNSTLISSTPKDAPKNKGKIVAEDKSKGKAPLSMGRTLAEKYKEKVAVKPKEKGKIPKHEQNGKNQTAETPNQKTTEKSKMKITEKPTDKATKKASVKTTEKSTMITTEKPTGKSTKKAGVKKTEKSKMKTTEKRTVKYTNKAEVKTTEKTSRKTTAKSNLKPTENVKGRTLTEKYKGSVEKTNKKDEAAEREEIAKKKTTEQVNQKIIDKAKEKITQKVEEKASKKFKEQTTEKIKAKTAEISKEKTTEGKAAEAEKLRTTEKPKEKITVKLKDPTTMKLTTHAIPYYPYQKTTPNATKKSDKVLQKPGDNEEYGILNFAQKGREQIGKGNVIYSYSPPLSLKVQHQIYIIKNNN